jgi:4-hydroxy-tetrahydrodipicolinate synthase
MQREAMGPDFIQLSGEDMTALAFNAAGGQGCISVVSNVAPALCTQLQDATLANDYPQALKIQDRLVPLHHAIFIEPGLAGAKCGLSLLGRGNEEVRSPLLPVTETARGAIKKAMVHAGLLN